MTETPREYKKRVDEKWINNEKNKNKLIEKIDEYELLDKKYKTITKQQILDNFSKNLKADKENENYLTIASVLGNIDKKYKELEELKEELNQKIGERESIKEKFAESELDGTDETTLNMQMANMHALMEQFDNLEKEIAEMEKEVANREQEIQEIESTYGVKEDEIPTEELSQTETESAPAEMVAEKPTTLKAHHEQTIKDLWNKDRTRKEIIGLLDDGTGIDDELKEKIKKEVSDRFFEYYDKKQGDVKTQAARFMKNKLKGLKTFEELRGMPEEDKEEKLKEREETEQTYGIQTGSMRLLLELEKQGIDVKSTEMEECGIIAGKPVFKVKNKNGNWRVYWGLELCVNWYREIGEIQNIGDKPCFKVKDMSGECVYWGTDRIGNWYKEIREIQNIGNKPCFKAMDRDGDYCVRWGPDRIGSWGTEIREIQNIGNKPCFKVQRYDGDWIVCWGPDKIGFWGTGIGEIQNIGDRPCFKVQRYDGDWIVYWGDKHSKHYYREIGEIKNDGGRPVCEGKDASGNRKRIKRTKR